MRLVCFVVLVLSPLPLRAQTVLRSPEANAWLLWEHPVAFHAISTYEATLTTVVNGQAVQRVGVVVPYSARECQVVAALTGDTWTPETLCAEVCVDAGELTVTLAARAPGMVASGSSNEAHATVLRPCPGPPRPTRPPPVVPPTSPLPSWALGVGVVTGAWTLTDPAPSLPELMNRGCVSWRIAGVCTCGFPPSPCLQVEYWEPTSLIDIVKQPGTSPLPILGDLLRAGLSAVGVSRFGGGGAGNSAGAGHTNLHYSEAHVWSFPQIYGGPCTGCLPVNALPRLQYASEADAVAWRTTTAPTSLPLSGLLSVGTWGSLFPRVGFVTHSSPPVASGLTAFRALNIAFQPVTPPPTPEAHIAISPAEGLTGCLQLASPKQTPCLLAGTPPAVPIPWDAGATSAQGSYVWLSWTKRSCCVPPPGTCGITMPPIGLAGDNLCPL